MPEEPSVYRKLEDAVWAVLASGGSADEVRDAIENAIENYEA